MRINSFLAKCGFGSRRSVEELVTSGRVLVNGKIVKNLATQINQNDKVTVDTKPATLESFVYYLLNKPVGYTSTTEDEHAKRLVTELVPKSPPVFPVGRLDKDSEGLIILTNDGEFANKLIHPRYQHEKEYMVDAEGPKEDLNQALDKAMKYFKCGAKLADYKTQPAYAKVVAKVGRVATFNIILKEGRKRQIRRVLNKAGFTVIKLKRIRIQNWTLDDLAEGKYRTFNP